MSALSAKRSDIADTDDNDWNDSEIAVFTKTTRTWINDERLVHFATKTGEQKVAFWGRKVAFLGVQSGFLGVRNGYFTAFCYPKCGTYHIL